MSFLNLTTNKQKKLENLTTNYIRKTFNEQTKKGTVRINKSRAKIEPAKGGLGIMDISPFWMGGKISWLRRLLQKDYNEEPRTNDHCNQ